MKAIKINRVTSYVTYIKITDRLGKGIASFSATSVIDEQSAEQNCYKKALRFCNSIQRYLLGNNTNINSIYSEKEYVEKHEITLEEINEMIEKFKKLIISSDTDNKEVQL